MNTMNKVVILDLATVLDTLADMYADKIVSNKEFVKGNILQSRPLNGVCGVLAPDFKNHAQMVELFAEFNLGERFAKGANLVAVKMAEFDLRIVWDIENVLPEERQKFMN
jgi:hypothetical protein